MARAIKRLCIGVLIAGAVMGSGFVAWAIHDLPDPALLQSRQIRQSTKIYDRTGAILLYEVHGEERRTIIPPEDIPDVLKNATIVAEDINFYQHPAFDIRGIIRGVIINPIFRGARIQGGSTITQQLAKNAFLTPERTITRKIRELFLAIQLERRYSKDEILWLYLNQIPYGSNAYGIEAAAQTHFNKSARDLTLRESVILAALPKAPSFYAANPNELNARVDSILNRMAEHEFITREQADAAKNEIVRFSPFRQGIRAPHFVMHVKQLLEEKYGLDMVENGGLRVITTLDFELQQLGEVIVERKAAENESRWNVANAALLAQDPKTGQILAMVGSRSFFEQSRPYGCIPGRTCMFDPQVNATMRPRQPGSAFKPFVYYAAFKKGYTPSTVVFDLPTEFNPNCSAMSVPIVPGAVCYRPQNFDESWRGPVSLRRALAQSLNIPAVKVLYLTGIDTALETARNFGITSLNQPSGFYGLSLALGGGSMKLSELTHAYSVLAHDGVSQPQTAILSVQDAQGNILEEFRDRPRRVAESRYIRLVNDILADSEARLPIFPAGSLDVPGHRVAVKTGTSHDSIDAWVFGYTQSLVMGAWVGNNNNAPISRGGAGVSAAGPIMREFMTQALPQFPQEDFPPAEVLHVAKPMLSGQYAVLQDGRPKIHSILYYVDRNDPLGPSPSNPMADPQFINWETPVRDWARLSFQGIALPEEQQQPEIVILEPQDGAVTNKDEIKIRIQVINLPDVNRVTVSFNGIAVTSLEPTPDNSYSLFFVPANWREENRIVISATSGRTQISRTITIYRAP